MSMVPQKQSVKNRKHLTNGHDRASILKVEVYIHIGKAMQPKQPNLAFLCTLTLCSGFLGWMGTAIGQTSTPTAHSKKPVLAHMPSTPKVIQLLKSTGIQKVTKQTVPSKSVQLTPAQRRRALKKRLATKTVPELLQILQKGKGKEKAYAILQLGKRHPRPMTAVSPLIQALQSKERLHRQYAAITLGRLCLLPQKVLPHLVKALRDKKLHVRWNAINAIGQYALLHQAAVPHLVQGLRHKDFIIKSLSLSNLDILGEQASPAIPALLRMLRHERSASLKSQAVSILGNFGPRVQHIVPLLMKQFHKHNHTYLKWRSIQAIGKIGVKNPKAIQLMLPLLKSPIPELVVASAYSLVRQGRKKEAIPYLAHALHHVKPNIRILAARHLGMLKGEAAESVPYLIMLLKEPNRSAQREAALALANIGPKSRPAIPFLRQLLNHSSVALRTASAFALVKLTKQTTKPMGILLNTLKHGHRYNKVQALRYLGELGPKGKSAKKTILSTLNKAPTLVRHVVPKTLRKLK